MAILTHYVGCFESQSKSRGQGCVTYIAFVAADRVIVTACFFLFAGG